jgi:hypothetical protein
MRKFHHYRHFLLPLTVQAQLTYHLESGFASDEEGCNPEYKLNILVGRSATEGFLTDSTFSTDSIQGGVVTTTLTEVALTTTTVMLSAHMTQNSSTSHPDASQSPLPPTSLLNDTSFS